MVSNEVSLIGTYGFDKTDFEDAVEILPHIRPELETFIEDRCRLTETPRTMTSLARGENPALKTVITFDA